MFKVQQNRYLWVHLVGLAAVPLLLDICLVGLASAKPAASYPSAFGFQFWTVALIGIVPSAWMQIQRPFYIYSLPPLAVDPRSLAENDRRCLTVFKSWQIKALAGVTAGFLLWLLVQLYGELPQILPAMRPDVGFISAIAAFFFACLFLQISVGVVRSLLIGQDTLQRVQPFETSEIGSNFLILGLRVSKILPTQSIVENVPTAQAEKVNDEKVDDREQATVPQTATNSTETEDKKDTDNLEDSGENSRIETTKLDSTKSDMASHITSDTAEEESEFQATESAEFETVEVFEPDDATDDKPDADALSTELTDPQTEVADLLDADSKPILEEPPLVIPEMIESDNSELNDNH